jgi:hypothetical protein
MNLALNSFSIAMLVIFAYPTGVGVAPGTIPLFFPDRAVQEVERTDGDPSGQK